MKKQKIKLFFIKNIYVTLLSFCLFGIVFGGYSSYLINSQYASETGSNNSLISFTGSSGNEGYYVNNEDNSAVIGNYFTGYYYDSLFGFFKLNWSNIESNNVRIIDSTDVCSTGYGYKLGGKAYSDISGYIDFNYSNDIFVYYCLDDGKLHGMAYGKYVGFQNFEGIEFKILNDVIDLTENISNDIFINDDTNINIDNVTNNTIDNDGNVNVETTTEYIETIGGDIIQIDDIKESIFYIIK